MVFRTEPISSMENAFSVRGLNVVISGGNRGIGYGIASAFAESGANVAILCRDLDGGRRAAERLSSHGAKAYAFRADVSRLESIRDAAGEVFEAFENLDVLINNAGISLPARFLAEENISRWNQVIQTDLNGTVYMTHAFAPKILEGGKGGSIINISSIGGRSVAGTKNHPNIAYHACKAAIDNLTRSLAIEFGDYGIRVNAVAPGPTHSDLDRDLPAGVFQTIEERMPMHRFGEPIEIGALCVYLASRAGCHITGTVITHDGGMLCIG